MRTVHWNGNMWDVHDNTLSVEQIKESFSQIDPAIGGATARVVGNNIYFEVRAGEKGC